MTAPHPLQYHGDHRTPTLTSRPRATPTPSTAAQAVTPAVVNQKIAVAAATLTTKAYTDQQDALRAHKTDVTAADTLYVATTQLGVPGGLATLDVNGFLPAAAIPAGIVTDRVARCFSVVSPAGVLGGTPSGTGAVGTVQLTGTHTVSTTVPREYQIASIPVPDLGYAYRPLPLAWVQGKAGGTDPGSRHQGNNNYGLLTVMAPPEVGNTVYAAGVCTGSPYFDMYAAVPYAQQGQTPLSVPAVNGALEFRLYGSCWSGGTYIFSPANIIYFVLCFPAL